MKTFDSQSARLQKWGLFCLLMSSLGFSLSMNPDHFNHIVRNEAGFQSLDLAQTAATEKTAEEDRKKTADTAPGERKKKEETIIVSGYKAHATEEGTGTRVRLEAFEGSVCVACGSTIYLNSSIDKLKDLSEELATKIDEIKNSSKDTKKRSTKDLLSGSDFDQDFLREVAAACKKQSKEDRLTCHSEKLVKMSNKLDDSEESENLVKRYFELNILPSLKERFSSRTTDPMTLAIDQSKLAEADEVARMLIEELSADNSEAVVSRLTKLKAGSYSTQLSFAREMYLTAQQDKASKDMFTMTRGFNMERLALASLDPTLLNSNLMMDRQNWRLSMEQGSKDQYLNMLDSNLYNPVRGLVGQLGNVNFYSTNPQDISTQLAQISIPDLSGMNMVPVNIGSLLNHTPGMPGNISPAIYSGRMQAGRGLNFPQLPMTQQFPTQSLNSVLTQPTSPLQTNPNLYSPALINGRSALRN